MVAGASSSPWFGLRVDGPLFCLQLKHGHAEGSNFGPFDHRKHLPTRNLVKLSSGAEMPAPTLDQRLSVRERPSRTPVMYQRWADLAFLHWQWDAAEIQATLPEGLHVDTHDGQAWLGIVPFWMQAVRPRGLPALPWFSWFLELNLRTYVHDDSGRPGVWFYSLDCNQPLAVALARNLFGLNYVSAFQTGARPDHAAAREFISRRKSSGSRSRFHWCPEGADRHAEPGSLEFFLAERYLLFSHRRGRLCRGQVWHEPYPLKDVRDLQQETALWVDQGFSPPDRAPDHTLCSTGVSVSIYSLR